MHKNRRTSLTRNPLEISEPGSGVHDSVHELFGAVRRSIVLEAHFIN